MAFQRRQPQPDGEQIAATLRQAIAALDAADADLAAELTASVPTGRNALSPAIRQKRRTQRCTLALRKGELYAAAAMALPADHTDRTRYLEKALRIFRTSRIDYHDLPAGLMGYVCEAKAQRQAGDPRAATAALAPPLAAGAKPKHESSTAEVIRLAKLEELEITLASSPNQAADRAMAWLRSPDIRNNKTWSGRVNWLLARAEVARLERSGRSSASAPASRPGDVAALLRDPNVIAAAPPCERLSLLAKLDALSGSTLMTRNERLAQAESLAAAGDKQALAVYQRALSMTGDRVAPGRMLTYAAVLRRSGRLVEAVDACDQVLAGASAGDPVCNMALQLRSAALLQLSHGSASQPAERTQRTLAALQAVVDSNLAPDIRRDALRQYVALKAQRVGTAQMLPLLAANRDLIGQDAYLLCAQALGSWGQLQSQMKDPVFDRSSAGRQAQEILAAVDAAKAAAASAGQLALAAQCALQKARMLAAAPCSDPKAALAELETNADLIAPQKDAKEAAAGLRVELLLDLGLVDRAAEAMDAAGSSNAVTSPAQALRLAEALSQRYETTASTGRGELQRRVVVLCERAIAQAVEDRAVYRATARRAAAAMLRVQAYDGVRQILEPLLASKTLEKQKDLELECSLLLVEAQVGLNRQDEAIRMLDDLATRHAGSAAVQVARGRCQMALGQPLQAAESFRRARSMVEAGTHTWCRATLGLAGALHSGGQAPVARDILRLAEALYPQFGNPTLLAELKRMRAALGTDGRSHVAGSRE